MEPHKPQHTAYADTIGRPHDGSPVHEFDRPRTFKDAAAALGVGYHVVQRAAHRGLIKTYNLGTTRQYVKLRDLIEMMERDDNR